jgi:aminomethyltransferase
MSEADIELQVAAIRRGVTLSLDQPVSVVRLGGEAAYDWMDALSPRDLFLRGGQTLHTLLLDSDGMARADLYAAYLDGAYTLFAEGVGGDVIEETIGALELPLPAPSVEDLGASHRLVGINGPYAWELLGELVGQAVYGVPYLASFGWPGFEGARWYRGGKTGEFGYGLLIPRTEAEAAIAAIRDAGRAFDLTEVGSEALDRCALENGFYCPRWSDGAPSARVDPIEMQLQWRVTYDRDYFGSRALKARRAKGQRRRATWLLGAADDDPPPRGDALMLDDVRIGEVFYAARSPTLGKPVAIGLLDLHWAHPGLSGIVACDEHGSPRGRPLRTVSVPLLRNRSLYIDMQRHSYAVDDEFPALVEAS